MVNVLFGSPLCWQVNARRNFNLPGALLAAAPSPYSSWEQAESSHEAWVEPQQELGTTTKTELELKASKQERASRSLRTDFPGRM